eukprot:Awhi_evm1s4886
MYLSTYSFSFSYDFIESEGCLDSNNGAMNAGGQSCEHYISYPSDCGSTPY